MSDELKVFSEPQSTHAVQGIRDLLSQSHVAFLFGAGCSYDAGLPLMSGLTEEVLSSPALGEVAKEIVGEVNETYSGAKEQTIEDYMSDLVDYLALTERRRAKAASDASVQLGGRRVSSSELDETLTDVKTAIIDVIENREPTLENHQRFVRSIHSTLEAGKSPRAIEYFVLNYDTLLEDALGIERISYCDGFAGGATGWWDPSTLENGRTQARVHKLHGSVDWCLLEGDTLPRRIRKGRDTESQRLSALIYPAATKFQEVQKDPFAQLLGYLRKTLRPAEREELVLCICGYGFRDSHINLEIENAMQQAEGSLTVMAFCEDVEETQILKKWSSTPLLSSLVRIYSSRSIIDQGESTVLPVPMPWWKFEVLAKLLGGER